MKHFIILLIFLSNIYQTNSIGISARSAKSGKSTKSKKSAKSPKGYHSSTSTIYTNTETITEDCCETILTTSTPHNQNQLLNYTTLLTTTSSSNVVSTLISIPTIFIPSSSTIPFTLSTTDNINSSFFGNSKNNSSQKISAAIISVISLSTFLILVIFVIAILHRKKHNRGGLNNQNYVENISYEEPVPIIEQIIDSYYGNVEEGIIYENEEDEDGYLYALPQSDCEQAIIDESYEIIPINQNNTQGNLYDKASQEGVVYDIGNNNYTYNDFC